MGKYFVIYSYIEQPEGPPLQFLLNPWHAVKMLLNPPSSGDSLEMPAAQDDQFPAPTVTKKNDLNILKSAYLFSKYAGAGKRLRKLKELKKTLTEKAEKEEGMNDPFFKLRNGWISY